MSRDAELDHLNAVAALIGVRVEIDGGAYAINHPGAGRCPVASLAAAGLMLGGMLAVSAELQAATTVAGARYGIGGSRAQRRADAKRRAKGGAR